MFRNFKHKPTEVQAVEVTADLIRSLDPEKGPIQPVFNERTGKPAAVEWDGGIRSSVPIGGFVVANPSAPGGFQGIDQTAFRDEYDPAW